MAKIPFSFGGGGGDSSDDCTAEAADILESKTAIYNGSDDDALAGTMKDYSGTSSQATPSMNDSNSRFEMTVPSTGKYDTAAKLYSPYSTVRSTIGYTDASKVLTGTTICGLAGTMADKSGSSTSATASLNNSNLRLQIPTNAYYNTSAYLYQTYSNIANLIGLTAAKLKNGNTILGISGNVREYYYGYYTYSTSTSTSRDYWYNGSASSRQNIRHFSLSDIGLTSLSCTPTYIIILYNDAIVFAHSGGANIFGGDASGYEGFFDASNSTNSALYKFSKDEVYIPMYFTSSGISAGVNIFGYT